MIKLASWNVNSLKIRLEQVVDWLESSGTHILALQETKLTDEVFPLQLFQEKGFYVAFTGQKTYNGVALISQHPIEAVVMEIPDYADPQRRVLAGTIQGIRVINLYVPNGAAVGSEKYQYKLTWLEKVKNFIQDELARHEQVAVVGDFNIAPEDRDVHDINAWKDCVLVSELERKAFFELIQLGLCDSLRKFTEEAGIYSWWDYRAAAFRRNLGLRIDHILLSPALNAHCIACCIDKEPRRVARPSDHAPVCVTLDCLG